MLSPRNLTFTQVVLGHRNSTHNAEVRSSIDYLTESLTTDNCNVAPKTTLRVAVLRRGLRGCCRRHRGPRLARGVAASGVLRAEPDNLFRHRAERPAAETEAVGSHRFRTSCHNETGRWRARWVKPMYVPAILYDRERFSCHSSLPSWENWFLDSYSQCKKLPKH